MTVEDAISPIPNSCADLRCYRALTCSAYIEYSNESAAKEIQKECCDDRNVFIFDSLLQCACILSTMPCYSVHVSSRRKPKLTVDKAIPPIAFANHWNIWRKSTMAKAHACTFAIALAYIMSSRAHVHPSVGMRHGHTVLWLNN